jgi:hypothetical protein
MDVVELNLRNMGVKRWRVRAMGKIEAASAMREVKAKCKGL